MNFIEHLATPKISFYCLDIAPFDIETFYQHIDFIFQFLFLLLNFMNDNLIENYN